MIYGLQTHIEGWVEPEELRFVRARGFQMARIAAMECSDDLLAEMVRDTLAADLIPFVTVLDPARLRLLAGLDCEWRNEDDGDLTPRTYRRGLDEACAVALEVGVRLWAPTISNLDRDSLEWLEDVRGNGWPPGLHGISAHRYGDGTFHDPHRGFRTRAEEVARLKQSCDGKPYVISEFGYPTLDGLTEAHQAERIAEEWAFWTEHGAYAALLFQIHDGSDPTSREHCYGIRRCNPDGSKGDWKPSAYSIPTPHEDSMNAATFSLRRAERIPHPTKAGYFTSPFPGSTTGEVASVNPPDGHVESRPQGTVGPFESWREEGNRAVFDEVAGYTFAIPLVD